MKIRSTTVALGAAFALCIATQSVAQDTIYHVIINFKVKPFQVTVAPAGSYSPPWSYHSNHFFSAGSAWGQACGLVINGDVLGRKYYSSEIQTGAVSC